MSGLARLANARGAVVTGSDRAASVMTDQLVAEGVGVVFEQSAGSVPLETEVLVISAAIPFDHPEVIEATRRGLEVVKYAAMLGRLMEGKNGVAIAGTHGKSSTTSMLGHVLIQCGLDPSVIVGAQCEQLGGGARVSTKQPSDHVILLAEACEFDRSFHNLRPTHAVILNVEADHLDIYGSMDEIVESFAHFAQLLPAEGSLLIQHGSPHRMEIASGLPCRVQTIGYEPSADWRIGLKGGNVRLHDRNDRIVAEWKAPLPGEHMAYNAACAAVMAHELGGEWGDIDRALAGFKGLDRRMQRVGEKDGVLVIDDYGHHPTEIDTTLRALRSHYKPKRLICVFQPHQHSRTRFLLKQFATSFEEADAVLVPDIFFVRDSEEERQAVTSNDLVEVVRQRGVDAAYIPGFDEIVEQVQVLTSAGDLVVTMGAGDVWKVGRAFLGD